MRLKIPWTGGLGSARRKLTILCLLAALAQIVSSSSQECNRTIRTNDLDPGQSLTFTLPSINRAQRGNSFYCWLRFEGSVEQYISVRVTDLQVGDFNADSRTCEGGYLRISDTEACSIDSKWLPPTEICGRFDEGRVRVKRFTRSPLAFVEYKVDKARTTKGYQFDVEFLDVAENPDDLPYGHLQRTKGRVENTKCDWLIDVDDCIGHCYVTSPGYPGIYPPNTRCRYTFVSFTDARVQLQMGGLGFSGKFDMKKSNNCTEDYVEVFDGLTTESMSFGRFCGNDGDYIVSSGSGMLLIFQSGPGGPPWDYSGFDLRLADRWSYGHEGGTLRPGTICDWDFESRGLEEGEGTAHTIDHVLENKTICNFYLNGVPDELINLEIVIRKLDSDCREYLEIFDGDKSARKICKENLIRTQRAIYYNSTTPRVSVRWVKTDPHISDMYPTYLYFTFVKGANSKRAGTHVERVAVNMNVKRNETAIGSGTTARAMTQVVLAFFAASFMTPV